MGQAAFSPDGKYYAVFNSINQDLGQFIDVFSFDRCSGILSNQRTMHLNMDISGGVAFSPNSRFLYVSSYIDLYQYDMWAADIESSKVKLAEFDNWQGVTGLFPTYWLMQLAPDGKIYFCTTNSQKLLHVIEEPNKQGYACNFRPHGLELPTWNSGIPNLPYFRLGPVEGSSCDSLGMANHPLVKWAYRLDSIDYKKVYFREFSDYLPDTYHWDFGDGMTSTVQEPIHTYTSSGVYDVCLIVSNANSTDTLCQVVVIDHTMILYPAGEIVIDSFACWPATIHIEADTEHADSILWEYFNGTSVLDIKRTNAATLDLDYVTPGLKIVHLTIYNELGSTKVFKRFFLYDQPVAKITHQNRGKYDGFAAFNSTGVYLDYQWDFGNGTTSTEESGIRVVYEEFGTYEVSLIASNVCGSDTAYHTVTTDSTTFDTLIMPFVYLRADTLYGCAPMQVKYEAITFNVDTLTWSFPGGSPSTSHENNVVVTYANPGEYVTEVKVTGSYLYLWRDSSEAIVTVVEGEKPIVGYSFEVDGLNIVITNESTNSTSFYWDFGDGTIDTTTSPIHTFAQPGNYDIVLIATNDCGHDTLSRNLIITGSEDLEIDIGYTISPNPSTGFFFFEAGVPLVDKLDITVYNLLGQVVLRKQAASGAQKMELDLRKQAAGIYWYRIDYLEKVGFGQLVKME